MKVKCDPLHLRFMEKNRQKTRKSRQRALVNRSQMNDSMDTSNISDNEHRLVVFNENNV